MNPPRYDDVFFHGTAVMDGARCVESCSVCRDEKLALVRRVLEAAANEAGKYRVHNLRNEWRRDHANSIYLDIKAIDPASFLEAK